MCLDHHSTVYRREHAEARVRSEERVTDLGEVAPALGPVARNTAAEHVNAAAYRRRDIPRKLSRGRDPAVTDEGVGRGIRPALQRKRTAAREGNVPGDVSVR